MLAAAVAVACSRPPASSAAQPLILWHTLGAWSGGGDAQTESFPSSTGSLRITWETSHESRPNAGRFRLTVMSAISGRSLQVAVDVRGVGHNIAYVTDDPRSFYAVVESSNVEWTFTVDEGVPAAVESPR